MNNNFSTSLINSTMFDSQLDLKRGKVHKKNRYRSGQRFWLISLVSFTLAMILIAFILILTSPTNTLSDKSCDNFSKDGPICLATGKDDVKRVYSTRTTYQQSLELFSKLVDPIEIPSKCQPIMFYLFSRHSIRFPKAKDIEEMSQQLPKLQSELINSYKSGKSELCEKDYELIKDWKLQMVPENDNHVTPTGIEATKQIAQTFYNRYPHLFNSSEFKFEVGVTSKVRTNETAHAFVEGLRSLNPEIEIDEKDYVIRDFLQFHTICKKKMGGSLPTPKELVKITESKLFLGIRERVSQRMGLERTIDDDELDIIYRSCGFEQAIYDKAPWCSLFTKHDLKVLETREDVETFYEKGPGREINKKMPCPLITDLYKAVIKAIAQPEKKSTYLYFSHAGAMARLYAAFNIFDKLSLDRNFCPKGERQWKTSLILPFNVHFDSILYRCTDNIESVNPSEYKLLTMVNGLPVEIDECDGPMCNVSKFLKEYGKMSSTCDLDAICKIPAKKDDD